MTKSNVRKVKAWAIVYKGGVCEGLSHIGNANNDFWTMFVHQSKKDARLALDGNFGMWEIVPCTITYSAPKEEEINCMQYTIDPTLTTTRTLKWEERIQLTLGRKTWWIPPSFFKRLPKKTKKI